MIRTVAPLTAALLSLATSGCVGVSKASNAYDELFAPVEGLQHAGKVMQEAPLQEVATGSSAWNHYELARRLELGLGVAKDPGCALFWYAVADRTRYDYDDWSHATVVTYPRVGIPQARIAMRRIRKSDPALPDQPLADDTLRSRCTTERARLSAC